MLYVASLAAVLSLLHGWYNGLINRQLHATGERRRRLGVAWHRVSALREAVLASALAVLAFGLTWAALAGAVLYASVRWLVFDAAHNLIMGQPLLYAGEIADTDGWLRRLPPWGRLAVKLGVLAAATALYCSA